MDKRQEIEYQTVILAALLHDIGKLLHRGSQEYKGKHCEASSKFIEKFTDKLKNDGLYDIGLLRLIVQHHHPKKQLVLQDQFLIGKGKKDRERIWNLIKIVMRADIYSCVERNYEQQRRRDIEKRLAPLDSIFSYINLDINKPQGKNNYRYHTESLDPLQSFPADIEALTDKEIAELIEKFESNIPQFSSYTRFDDVVIKWINLLEQYTWAVPSDTRYETSDVSLYDHLRSSAAIAACLYKRHIEALEGGKNLSTANEFVFIGGDFSGIQNYIFDITNRGSGGASKRLRARSFFIYVFSEVTIHKILHTLDLPMVCNLFSAGGKFLLLAPSSDAVINMLNNVKKEIEKEIHETYFNQFSFLMSFMSIEDFRKKFKVFNFFETADEMFHRLEIEKIRKSKEILFNNDKGSWNADRFKVSALYEKYQGNGDCAICGKGPATYEEPGKGEEGDVVRCCFVCYRDKIFLGQELPKCNYIAFGKGFVSEEDEENGEKIVIFHHCRHEGEEKKDCYYVELLDSYKYSDEYYLIYNIGKANEKTQPSDLATIKKYYANYVPFISNSDSKKKIVSFEEFWKFSTWQKEGDNNGKSYGTDLLGVLKADVDNLGLVFSKGFEHQLQSGEGLRITDIKTVSRYLTMSRMLELFFSGWIKETISGDCKETLINELTKVKGIDEVRLSKYLESSVINFKNIYTVYSGGDDMVFIGPWETLIVFSIFLNLQFRRYTCNNKFITLSAGLNFVKPKYPIASALKQAETLLEKSKEYGKDRITLFGTTVEWSKLSKLVNFFLFLNEKLNDKGSEIKMAFLYRLLEYHRMALRYFEQNMVEGLKYLSALSYDVGRNIVEKDKSGIIKKGHEEQKVLQDLINERLDNNSLIYNIKIPLFWTLYRNRRAREDDNLSNF